MAEVLPFEQQPGESAKAFAAFVVYRDMRSGRSLEAVSQELSKSIPLLKRWSRDYDWVARARSYDAAVDARLRHATEQEAVKRRRAMLQEHAGDARRLRAMAGRILDEFERRWEEKECSLEWVQGPDFLKLVALLPKVVETAHQLERLATGEPAQNLEPPKPFEQMSNDELSDYITRLRRSLTASG